MRKLIKQLIRATLTWVTRCTPKQNIYVLRGYPSYEDNLVAIYEELLLRGIRRIVWVTDDVNIRPPIAIDKATKFVARNRLGDYFYSTIARYLIITHGHFIDRIPPNQFCVNLWHGIPYKAIGKLDGSAGRTDSMVVATSELTRDIFSKAFGIDPSRVAITGQARTDRLFVQDPKMLRQRVFPAANSSSKLFLWLPTFRATGHAGGRTDGKHFNNMFNCSQFDELEFNRYLAAHNCVCFVKPHPMAFHQHTQQRSNIVYIDEHWLLQNGMTLYQFGGLADCLISDISSIIVDFMLLDRPIVLLFEDIQEYEASRGFTLNPITDWLPAPVTLSFDSFMDEVKAVTNGEDRHQAKRHQLKSMFFAHDDASSSARILDLVSNQTGRNESYTPTAT